MNIIVHAPPRTGGFSVRYLFENYFKVPCFHAHYLQNEYYYADKRKVKYAIDRRGRESFKVICTVRDPIARNLSEYWRLNYIDRPEKPITAMRVFKGLYKKAGTDEEKFIAYIDHYRQHHFFGSELIPFWGIDIFDEGFEPPYTIYDNRLLIIRCEDLDEHGGEAIFKLTGMKSIDSFPRKNVIPVERETISLSEAYIDAMFRDITFPVSFYSEVEIEGMKIKWTKQTQLP